MIPHAFAASVTINPSVPFVTVNTVPGLIQGLYLFALSLAGVLAFGAIVYGGVKYATGRGNPGAETDARSWITGALLGLLLLAGAYIILQTVNPALVTLGIPQLPALRSAGTLPSVPVATTTASCFGGACLSLADAGFSCKPAYEQPNAQLSCAATQEMINTLKCITSQPGVPAIEVTEAMPPTVPHISHCHNDGCCVDTVVQNFTGCSQVTALMHAVAACGTTAANEYIQANCPGAVKFDTTQGNNVHINAKGCR